MVTAVLPTPIIFSRLFLIFCARSFAQDRLNGVWIARLGSLHPSH